MNISRTLYSSDQKHADTAVGGSSSNRRAGAKKPYSPSLSASSSDVTFWNDLNDIPFYTRSDLIPGGTCAWVRMRIRPGGYNDPLRGWYGGYATLNTNASGSVMLACEATVIDAPYRDRRIAFHIGLHSSAGAVYAAMGRNFLRSILNSAGGFAEDDTSPAALNARRIQGFEELNDLRFLARIEAERGIDGKRRNTIRTAVTPDMAGWFALTSPSSTFFATSSNDNV